MVTNSYRPANCVECWHAISLCQAAQECSACMHGIGLDGLSTRLSGQQPCNSDRLSTPQFGSMCHPVSCKACCDMRTLSCFSLRGLGLSRCKANLTCSLAAAPLFIYNECLGTWWQVLLAEAGAGSSRHRTQHLQLMMSCPQAAAAAAAHQGWDPWARGRQSQVGCPGLTPP